jgi:uncharacterized repeat protein (TIGR03803 family)
VAWLGAGFDTRWGTVFRILLPGGELETLHIFDRDQDGNYPAVHLLEGAEGGVFYGTTSDGGHGAGTVFRITADPVPAFSVLHTFTGPDGAYPLAPLVETEDGSLFGTAHGYGFTSNLGGTIFKIAPDGTFSVLHQFPAPPRDQFGPLISGLVEAADGNLYGTTGGANGIDGFGTVFRMTPDGTFSYAYQFTGGADGAYPRGELIQTLYGNFYGVTLDGGVDSESCSVPGGCGTLFEMTPDGTVSVLHAFTGRPDGALKKSALLEATDGKLYGTTMYGGGRDLGVVFRLTLVYRLDASPDTLSPGDPITVSWNAPPGRSAADWIGLFPVGASNEEFISRQYTDGASCGSIVFSAPDAAGQYELRYLPNSTFVDVARSNVVSVAGKGSK